MQFLCNKLGEIMKGVWRASLMVIFLSVGAADTAQAAAPKTPRPQVAGGIRNYGNLQETDFAQGSIASILGENLALRDCGMDRFPLRQRLCGTRVKIMPFTVTDANRRKLSYARLVSVRRDRLDRLDFQVPSRLLGRYRVQIVVRGKGRRSASSAIFPIEVKPWAPGFVEGSVQHTISNTLVTAQAPALRSEVLTIFLTGLGSTSPAVADGQPAPLRPLARAVIPFRLELTSPTGQTALVEVLFSGRTPNFAGLDQVNFRIPSVLPASFTSTGGRVNVGLRACDQTGRCVDSLLKFPLG